jgi:peroxiredoxin
VATPPFFSHCPLELPEGLPAPVDDGAAAHLTGAILPRVPLRSTSGLWVAVSDLTRPTVLFFYPRTGVPGQPPALGYAGEAWDSIPAARGCTPQSCGYRDLHGEFAALGVQVYGVSTSTTEHQREFAARMRMPFEMLSDSDLALVTALKLPTLRFPVESGGPDTLIRRMAWYVEPSRVAPVEQRKRRKPLPAPPPEPRIVRVWYPVFPADQNAREVWAWVRARVCAGNSVGTPPSTGAPAPSGVSPSDARG